ncbi:ankyrin repeat domain-containing protein [Desulfococcaceae bacterium HSG9]|nr:ankyrin repeat domain-containing protein [Desulfococcaceae bacterium HSG9]
MQTKHRNRHVTNNAHKTLIQQIWRGLLSAALFINIFLVCNPMIVNGQNPETTISADVKSGKLKLFGEIKVSANVQVVPTGFFKKGFGSVWQMMPNSSTLPISFQIPSGVSAARLKIREIGYPNNSKGNTLIKVNGKQTALESAQPNKRKIHILDVSEQIREGTNELTISTSKTTIGIQTISLTYAMPLPTLKWDSERDGMSLTLTSPVKGQLASLEKGIKIAWRTINLPEGARVTVQYSAGDKFWKTLADWIPYNQPSGKGNSGYIHWKPSSTGNDFQFRVLYNGVVQVGASTLSEAITSGNYSIVKAILHEQPDLAMQIKEDGENGRNALHLAAFHGQADICYLLLPLIDVNSFDGAGNTALHLAALQGRRKVVELLLTEEADVNPLNNDGATPLTLAGRSGHKVVQLLLKEFDAVAVESSSIFSAVQKGDIHAVKILLKKKPELVNDTLDQLQPIHIAAKEGNSEIIKVLLANGADSNAQDTNGFTALHIATIYGKRAVIKILLSQGANVNAVDKRQRAPLHLATLDGRKDMVKLLLTKGASIDVPDSEGRTPLDIAESLYKQYVQKRKRIKSRTYKKIMQMMR